MVASAAKEPANASMRTPVSSSIAPPSGPRAAGSSTVVAAVAAVPEETPGMVAPPRGSDDPQAAAIRPAQRITEPIRRPITLPSLPASREAGMAGLTYRLNAGGSIP